METLKSFCASILMIVLLLGVCADLFAEEKAAEVIDKTNWKKADGLVPEPLLEWIRVGEFLLPVGQLDFDPLEYWPSFVEASRQGNAGKYGLNEDDVIVDAETGQLARHIVGTPFPKVDSTDPKAATKIIYNKHYASFNTGNKRFTTVSTWLGRSGLEREITILFLEAYLTGTPGTREIPNPRDIERYNLVSVRSPYDLAGTTIMLWRYLSEKPDVNYSYIPAIRRVRRMTPANRSDGMLGSDMATDDAAGYDGKVPAFTWRLVGQSEALASYGFRKPLRVTQTENGEWEFTPDEAIRLGFQDENATVAAWCPLSPVYVKRPVWVIEAKAEDPYYNYGTQYIWIDRETWTPVCKVIHDRSGKFWKLLIITHVGLETAGGEEKGLLALDHLMVDTRRDHATYLRQLNPACRFTTFAELDLNDFSLAGFQKYCK
jgi:hypothetical protein